MSGVFGRCLSVVALTVITGWYCFAVEPVTGAQLLVVRGTDVSIRNNAAERNSAPPLIQQSGIVYLNDYDIVQTGPGTFVDIAVGGDRPLVKLAENTSLAFRQLHSYGALYDMALMYGRVLVSYTGPGSQVRVQTGSATTQVDSGDINIDYIVQPKPRHVEKPALHVSVLSGSAVVLPQATVPLYGRIQLMQNQSILFDEFMQNFERGAMNHSIVEYWGRNGTGDSDFHIKTGDENIIIGPEIETGWRTSARTAGIITGVALVLGGITVQGLMHVMESTQIDKRISDKIYDAGYVPIGLGSFVLIASYLAKTPD